MIEKNHYVILIAVWEIIVFQTLKTKKVIIFSKNKLMLLKFLKYTFFKAFLLLNIALYCESKSSFAFCSNCKFIFLFSMLSEPAFSIPFKILLFASSIFRSVDWILDLRSFSSSKWLFISFSSFSKAAPSFFVLKDCEGAFSKKKAWNKWKNF